MTVFVPGAHTIRRRTSTWTIELTRIHTSSTTVHGTFDRAFCRRSCKVTSQIVFFLLKSWPVFIGGITITHAIKHPFE